MKGIKTNIKVIEKQGEKFGKVSVILAGVHGNESPGIRAFDEILPNLKIEFGKVIFIYANLEAIKQNKRFIEKNLNRCFFKNQSVDIKQTLEGETAKEIMSYLDSADFALDLHASFTEDSIPFVICDEMQIKNANIFDSEIVSYNWDSFEPGSTDNYMNLQNKPCFCFECGYLGNEKAVEDAKKAIYNFLIFTGNINGEILKSENQRYLRIKDLFINKKGLFRKSRYFKDFEKVNEKVIIGLEGDKIITIDKNNIVLFLRDSEKLNEECFLVAEEISKETLINKSSFLERKNLWKEGTKLNNLKGD